MTIGWMLPHEAARQIGSQGLSVDSLLVVRNGYLVADS